MLTFVEVKSAISYSRDDLNQVSSLVPRPPLPGGKGVATQSSGRLCSAVYNIHCPLGGYIRWCTIHCVNNVSPYGSPSGNIVALFPGLASSPGSPRARCWCVTFELVKLGRSLGSRPEHNMLQSLPIILFSNSQKPSLLFFQFLPIILKFMPVMLILRKEKNIKNTYSSTTKKPLHV